EILRDLNVVDPHVVLSFLHHNCAAEFSPPSVVVRPQVGTSPAVTVQRVHTAEFQHNLGHFGQIDITQCASQHQLPVWRDAGGCSVYSAFDILRSLIPVQSSVYGVLSVFQ